MEVTDEILPVIIKLVAVRLGYNKLKPCQENAVKSFVLGNDLLLSLPTLTLALSIRNFSPILTVGNGCGTKQITLGVGRHFKSIDTYTYVTIQLQNTQSAYQ